MKKLARILNVLICLLLAFGMMAGCAQTPPNAATSAPAGAATAPQTTVAPPEKPAPVTFTMFNCQPSQDYENFESPVARKITELTGVTLRMEYPVGDAKDKISLMAAGGEYTDYVFAQDSSNILYDAGALVKFDDYIDKFGENVKKFYGDYLKRHKWSIEDPSIYYLGCYYADGQSGWEQSSGFQLQNEVLKELNYPKLATVQDFENAIKTYIEKYPEIDGQPTIGYLPLADGWRVWISIGNPAVWATGLAYNGDYYVTDPETLAVQEILFRPEMREYFKWLNHMYDIGLIDKEFATQKYDTYLSKIASGRVLALTDSLWEYSSAEQALRQAGKTNRMYARLPLVLREGMKNTSNVSPGFNPSFGVMITKSCKDPERAFRFLDWMCSDEAQVLNNWGIEGVNYITVDGKRTLTREENSRRLNDTNYKKETGVGVYTFPFSQHGPGTLDATGQPFLIDLKDDIAANYPQESKDTLKAYGVKLWFDLWPPQSDFDPVPAWAAGPATPPADSEYNIIQQKIQDIQLKYYAMLVIVKPAEFDATYDAMLQELKDAGVERSAVMATDLIKQRIQLYEAK
jgi:putative aldouronate transport system substrate-binding protein